MTVIANYTTFRAYFATAATLDVDGMEVWPVANVRASGFTGGFTGIGAPIQAFPITVSCNGGATDAADGTTYAWFLSQRTEDTAAQWMSIVHSTAGTSGTVTISLTAKCVTDLGLASATASLTDDELQRIVKHCHLYCQRQSDKAIQWVDILDKVHSDQ
jgi:hypothetical protein